ncbi:3-deoxy-D-manno-octulosonic acid transferase, partial [Pseudomonas syringae pv. tagetis]
LLKRHPDAQQILVPRHPERFDSEHALSQQQGFTTVRRSSMQAVTADVSVLMGDTMGELLFLYAMADIAFVGGSLVPNGGH